jgi:hypothetical protein
MTQFTATAMLEANEQPVLRYGRFVYEGRILSAPEWLVFWDRYLELMDAIRSASEDLRAISGLQRRTLTLQLEYLRAVFPRSRYRFWAPDPVKLLTRGHPKDLRDAFDAFFSLQARAMGHATPTTNSPRTSPTDGTSSRDSTPDASERP